MNTASILKIATLAAVASSAGTVSPPAAGLPPPARHSAQFPDNDFDFRPFPSPDPWR
jgi:hypothetical protein